MDSHNGISSQFFKFPTEHTILPWQIMLVRLLKQLLLWIYPRYAGSKGQLCNTGEENGYWINETTTHLTAISKVPESFLGPYLSKRRWWFLSSLCSTPFLCLTTLSQFHLLCPFYIISICPLSLISDKASALVFLLYLLSTKWTAVVPALQAATPHSVFIFLPDQAEQFHLSAALLRLPQQGAASALTSQASVG